MWDKAAKIAGAGQIIAVDRIKSRIELAKSFGATHGFDTTGVDDLFAGFKEVAGGNGPTVVVDSKIFALSLMSLARANALQQRATSP